MTTSTTTAVATLVPEEQRLKFLPKHLGRQFLRGEMLVYDWMDRLAPSYMGGLLGLLRDPGRLVHGATI